MKMKIVCDDKIPFLRGVLEPYAEVVYLSGKKTTREDVKDADAIITRTRTICNRELLEGSSVKVIATATIGFDHIDTKWVESNGIVWRNAPGCNSWSVKQYMGSVLCTLAAKYGFDLSKMTLGVVGVGNVGSKVACAASALGMKVLLNDPPRARKEGAEGFVSLDEIIRSCDIITVHVPLNKEGEDRTVHLFDEGRIASMRSDQILCNSSRGQVVDNKALKQALKEGRLKGGVLDVWEGEPDLDRELISLLDITTAHIAGYSADGKANGTIASVRTVSEILGLPLADWKPSQMPAPEQSLDFSIDAAGKTFQQVLGEAILHTYEVEQDSRRLREHPELFETLRGDYQIRREPSAFTLHLKAGSAEMEKALRQLDFNVVTD